MTTVIEREGTDWQMVDDSAPPFDEVEVGDLVWPVLGRPGQWPCDVIRKSRNTYLVKATFDDGNWSMLPVWLVVDDDLQVVRGSQDFAEISAFHSTLY
jgi:hypothetical protein